MSMLPTYETCYDCSSLILLASTLSISKKKWKEEITLSYYWPLYAQCKLLNSTDSGSMIHIVQTIDSWCMLHMSSICDTCYWMMMLVQRDRDQYDCSSIWYLSHDSSMLSIIVSHLLFTFMAYQCSEHTTWMWSLYSCSIFKTWESVTANVTINALVTINSLWEQSEHLNIVIIVIIMHFDCIVKQFIICYLVVVYHCIANHFPAQNHRHHHRHHHAWRMSIHCESLSSSEPPSSSSSSSCLMYVYSPYQRSSSNIKLKSSLPYCHCFSICCSTCCRYQDRGSNYRYTANLWRFRCITSVDPAIYTYSAWVNHDVLSTISEHLNKAADILQHTVSKVLLRASVVWMCAWICMCLWQRTRERERERDVQ